MADRKRVGVVMGGISSEHDVSLASGVGMLKNLDPLRYVGFPVLISRENLWVWPDPDAGETLDSPETAAARLAAPPTRWHTARFPIFPEFPRCDIFALALHGVGGEDGRLQGFLDLAGQPYTGSGVLGSALAIDKIASKRMYEAAGIPTARYRVLGREDFARGADILEREFGYPVVVKVPRGGSSIGVGIAADRAGLESLLPTLQAGTDRLLAEEYLRGREGSCGYLAGYPALPPTEIRPSGDGFFSYEDKYQVGKAREITPAEFPAAALAEMQSLAARCHHALQLSVYSRSDMILVEDKLYVLETNNLPGFTPNSLLPQAAAHAGLNYRDLLTRIIEESLKKERLGSGA